MKLKELLDRDADLAWESLNQRLTDDGLLDSQVNPATTRKPHKKVLIWAASVAAVFIAVVSIGIFQHQNIEGVNTLVLQNGQGEPTLVTTLEDGSTVYLNEETLIEYPNHFTSSKREIRLDGDAFFEITRNEECPFIIDTETVLIEVLGTSFSVNNKNKDAFSLSVRDGEVRITNKSTGTSSHVKAGQTALVTADKLETVSGIGQESFRAYFSKIFFKDQTLDNVLRIINEREKDTVQITCAPNWPGRN